MWGVSDLQDTLTGWVLKAKFVSKLNLDKNKTNCLFVSGSFILSIPWTYVQIDHRIKERGTERWSTALVLSQACVWCLRPELDSHSHCGALAAMPPHPHTSLPKSCRSVSSCTGLMIVNVSERHLHAIIIYGTESFLVKKADANSCFLELITYCWVSCHQMSLRWGMNIFWDAGNCW